MGWNLVFFVGAAASVLGIVAGFGIERVETDESGSRGGGFRELLKGDAFPVLLTYFAYGTLMAVALGGVNLIIPLYLDSRFVLSASQIGLFFTAQSLVMLVTQIPSGALADRYGKRRTFLSLIVFIPFLLASWHFVGDWRFMLVLNSLAFGLWSMTWPALLSLLSNSVPSRLVGAAFGLNNTGNRFGQTIGPVIASYFFINYFQTAPFLVASMFCFISVLIAFKIKDVNVE
jgi:MFS family permease